MLTLLLLCAVQKPREAPPADPRDLTSRFEAGAALTVTEWAGPEQLSAPLAIDVDWRGRVWVLEGGEKPQLTIFEDTASAGFSDARSVFHAWEDTVAAPGLAVVGRRALVASASGWLAVADVDETSGPRQVSKLPLPWECASACRVACVSGPGGQLWMLARNAEFSTTLAHHDGSRTSGFATLSARATGIALDSFGDLFVSERAADGAPGRVQHLNAAGAVSGSATLGDPRGLVSYESNFIAEFENTLLVADRAGSLVSLTPTQRGTTVEFQERVALAPRAGAEVEPFAPLDLAVGLDGALFVLDEGAGRGARILRIATKGRRVAMPRLSLTVTNGLLSALLSPTINVQATAFELLAAEGSAVEAQVQGLARTRFPRWNARALWLLARGGETSRAVVREQLSHEDPQLRAAALRALASAGHDALDLARRFRGDPSSGLRAQALNLLTPLEWSAKRECIADLLAPWPAGEELFADALARAVGPNVDAFAAALDANAPKGLATDARGAVLEALRRRRGAR